MTQDREVAQGLGAAQENTGAAGVSWLGRLRRRLRRDEARLDAVHDLYHALVDASPAAGALSGSPTFRTAATAASS